MHDEGQNLMPLCCFTRAKTGETIERFVKPGTKWIRHRGKIYRRDIVAEHGGRKQGNCALWPKVSWAAGVHPDQVDEAKAFDRKMGVPTDYTSDGEPILTSHKHRREYLKIHKLIDRSAFY